MAEIPFNSKNQTVGVYLRLCPPKSKYTFIESITKDKKSIQIAKDFEIRNFKFDNIFIPTDKQLKVFMKSCTNVLKGVVNGLNGSIIAYGQTGSGKTFTILGDTEKNIQGILQYSLAYLLSSTKNNLTLEISAVEIYMNGVFDIFSESENKIPFCYTTKKGCEVKNLCTYKIEKTKDLEGVLKTIFANRKTKKTRMNVRSSRSHGVFRVKIYNPEFKGFNYLNIVDLAGSERVKKSQIVDSKTLEETISINTSLMALGKCINFLSQNNFNNEDNSFSCGSRSDKSIEKNVNGSFLSKKDIFTHIPYRDSKLTMLLQNCLNGKSLLSLVVTISPDDFNVEESFSSLRFADNSMNLEIKPIRNKTAEKKKVTQRKQSPDFIQVDDDKTRDDNKVGSFVREVKNSRIEGVRKDENFNYRKNTMKNDVYENGNNGNFQENLENKNTKNFNQNYNQYQKDEYLSNKGVKDSQDNYYTNFTFQEQEERHLNFRTKGKSDPGNEEINNNNGKLINSEKQLYNKNLSYENNENFMLNNKDIFEENYHLKKDNEKLVRENEELRFLINEQKSKETENSFYIKEKDFGEVWARVDHFLFEEKSSQQSEMIKFYCEQSKRKISSKEQRVANLTLRANLLEKICRFNFYESFQDNIKAYFAAKKIYKFWKKFKNLSKKSHFNDFQKIKIQMGKSMLTKIFNTNAKLLEQIFELVDN